MATDVLAPCVARPSAIMALTIDKIHKSLSSTCKDFKCLNHLSTDK